jgi:hypothetical protein
MKAAWIVIKKNLVSIISGVVALLAVGALYWPMSGLYADLETRLDARIAVSSSLDSLAKQSRSMPLLSPDQTTPDPLTVFPTQPVIDAGVAATQQMSQQATNMLQRAVTANQHLPLEAGELPKPSDSMKYTFAKHYAELIDNYNHWQQILDSTMPPTPAEVQAAKDKLKADIDRNRLVMDATGTNPTADSQAEAQQEFDIESPSIQPSMELQRAQQHRIYLSPTAFPVDPSINEKNALPGPEKICDAQVVLWVLDDVCTAIARANDLYSDPAITGGAPVHDILHAPVKSLDGVDAPYPVLASTGVDPTAGVSAAAPKVPAVSLTGRVCNGLYDVLRFKIRMVVDAAKIPQIIRELEVGQFITVLNFQLTEVVDPAAAAASSLGGFHYGNKPCVRVELDCEELLMRKWTDNILPDDRKGGLGKGQLGTSPDNGGGPAGGGGQGGPPPGIVPPPL